MAQTHDRMARQIARRYGDEYNPGRGPDIRAPSLVVEVGTDPAKVREEMRQVANYQRRRYVAGPRPFVRQALQATHGTGIGVMTGTGRIVKRGAARKK